MSFFALGDKNKLRQPKFIHDSAIFKSLHGESNREFGIERSELPLGLWNSM